MSRGARWVLACAAASLVAACGGAPSMFSPAEWEKIATHSPLPPRPPDDPTNRLADDDAAAAFGQRLFFDARLSGPIVVVTPEGFPSRGGTNEPRKTSCETCHGATSWFSDSRHGFNAQSLGVKWTSHNAPSLVNVAYYDWFAWAGGSDSLWMQSLVALESSGMGGSRLRLAHVLWDHHAAEYAAVFGEALPPQLAEGHLEATRFPPAGRPKRGGEVDGDWELKMTDDDRQTVDRIFTNAGKAFAAYLRRLRSGDAPFDRFATGRDEDALGAAAKRGLKLFVGKAACDACHRGPLFSDQAFYNTGVGHPPGDPQPDEGRRAAIERVLASPLNGRGPHSDAPDQHRLDGLEVREADLGRFRTKSLRQIAMTGPYFHHGGAQTLEEVILFYDRGGDDGGFLGVKDPLMVPLNLDRQEVDDLVAFLGSLTGEPPDRALTIDPATGAPP